MFKLFNGPLLLKSCTGCNIQFPLENFNYASTGKYNRRGECKPCQSIKTKQNPLYNPVVWKNKYNKELARQRNAAYRAQNKEKLNEYNRNYYKNNKLRAREYYQLNKERINQTHNTRRKTDIQFKLGCRLRDRINKVLKKKQKVGSAVRDLGCSVIFLKQYLESKFYTGMTWENYGAWHIDHIIPLSMFNLENKEEFLQACHYSNLQPLWAKDNLSKGARYIILESVL
jgi:hypothetical protein